MRTAKRILMPLLSLLLVVSISDATLAQKTRIFTLAPRDATRPLKIAERAIKDGDFDEAANLLGELLATEELNQYLIAAPSSRGSSKEMHREVSLRQKVENLLGEIPAENRTAYQEKYGVRAEVMLSKAIKENDVKAIAMTGRLYFHTPAGLEATMLTGHTHLAEGRPAMAAVAFEKVAAQPEGRERFDPEATLLAAVSWSLNRSPKRAEKLLADLKQRHDGSDVLFYGKRVALFGDDTPVQTWLKEIVAATPLQSHPVVNQWLVFRGDAQRNAESGGGFPLLSPRWSLRTVIDPTDEEGIQQFQQKLIKNKISPTPKVHPLAIGKTLVIRTDDRMYGVDAESGKRIWSYPPADVFRSQNQKAGDANERPSKKLHQDKLRERLWLDALYGQISSDGESIFLVPNPGISTDRDDWRSYQTQVYDEPTDLRLYNELKSLDLKQQGSLQWQVGGETGLDEPKLAKAFFLGAPLPIDDRLYVMCLKDKSVNLFVLDAETGKVVWERNIASTEESISFREDRLRRLAGATPSEANGILICPTGLNAIVAIDIATQSLRWGFQFKEPRRKRIDRLTDQLTKWDTLWRDATVTLTGDAVIYTPIDSEELYCLDLQTGESLWGNRRSNGSQSKYKAMHVETVRSRQIILTSSDRLKALDLDSGSASWTLLLGDYGLVSGRGYVSGDHCYIPTTTKKVLRINAATGKVDGVAMTEKVLGNLISFRGDVISHGADHLTAYPRDEPSRLLLAQAPEQQPADHSLLSIKAQLHLLDGQYAESVDAISQAYDIFPNSNYARVLVQALTQLINVDFAKAEQVSNRYQNLFEKQDLQRLLRGKVNGLINLDRWDEAFETLIEMAETIELTPSNSDDAGERIDNETSVTMLASSVDQAQSLAKNSSNAELTLQLKQWLRWKFGEVYKNFDQREKDHFRKVVSEHLTTFGREESLSIRHQRMRLFPIESLEEEVRISIAAELYDSNSFAMAAGVLGNLLSANKPNSKDETEASQDSGAILSAKQLLKRMIELDFPVVQTKRMEDVVTGMEKESPTDRDVLDADFYALPIDSSKSPQRLRTDDLDIAWAHDVKRIEQKSNNDFLYVGTQHFCEVISSDQPELKKLVFTYSDEFRQFKMHDRLGRFVQKIYLDPDSKLAGTKRGTKGQIFLHKSLMLLCLDQEMFALDWEKFIRGEPALLWSAENVVPTSRGITSDTLDGVCVQSGSMLMCLNPFTGEVLWQRTRASSRTTLLEGSKSLTIWSRSGRTYDKVDRTVGRLLECGKMKREFGSSSLASGDLQLFRLNQRAEVDPQSDDEDEELEDTVFATPKQVYDEAEFTMYDFDQQKTLWTKTMAFPAHTTKVDEDNLLMLSSSGTFSMIDIRSGEVKFETEVPELQNVPISGIDTQRMRDSHLVLVNSIAQAPEFLKQGDTRVTFKRMDIASAMLSGHLVLLDAKSGESKWKLPIEVQRFQLLEGIPWDSPFLFLFRKNAYESETIQARVQVAMIDVASGKLKANELFKVPIRDGVYYQLVCLPRFSSQVGQTIELQIATLQTRFILEDRQTAPQPVAALTNAGSFKRMKEESATSAAAPPLVTDLQALIDDADAAQQRRAELRKEEARLTEIEMQSK